MLLENLYNPHVTVIHDSQKNLFFSVLMIVPKDTLVMYRDFKGGMPPQSGAKMEMKFTFNPHDRTGWHDLPNPKKETIETNGDFFDILNFTIQIDDLKTARLHTDIDHHPHKGQKGILLHEGAIHLPGGQGN